MPDAGQDQLFRMQCFKQLKLNRVKYDGRGRPSYKASVFYWDPFQFIPMKFITEKLVLTNLVKSREFEPLQFKFLALPPNILSKFSISPFPLRIQFDCGAE